MRHVRFSAFALLSALAVLPACDDEPAPAPAAAPKPPPKPKSNLLQGTMNGIGPITATTPPTVEAIDALLDEAYTVRPAQDAPEGVTVQVLFKDSVVLNVFPTEAGDKILRAVSTDAHVVFPWETKVGQRMGDHHNWERMTCKLAEKPYEGKAVCHAFEAARVGYLVEGWAGEPGVLPGKELVADAKIAGVVWTPTHGK